MPTQRTWADIVAFVEDITAKETARPNARLYLLLANQALGIMSRRTNLYKTSWDNSAGGDLTLTNATCRLPLDLIKLESVEWDGDDNVLDWASEERLDESRSGWRSETGDPDAYTTTGVELVLCAIPSDATGKLVIRGTATLPELSETETTSTTPLRYVPWEHQLLPAYYIIAGLPVVPLLPVSDADMAMRMMMAENERRYAVRQEYKALWDLGLEELISTINRRKMRETKY